MQLDVGSVLEVVQTVNGKLVEGRRFVLVDPAGRNGPNHMLVMLKADGTQARITGASIVGIHPDELNVLIDSGQVRVHSRRPRQLIYTEQGRLA